MSTAFRYLGWAFMVFGLAFLFGMVGVVVGGFVSGLFPQGVREAFMVAGLIVGAMVGAYAALETIRFERVV